MKIIKKRIIIAGGRDFDDFEKLCYEFSKHVGVVGFQNIEIISGLARGADMLGVKFANDYGVELKKFPAQWDLYGKSAGYIRNEEMAKYASEYGNGSNGMLIAFWDGKSKGTKHMIDLAVKYNLRTRVVEYRRNP